MIRVLVVDDQALVRSGLIGLLNLTPDIRVVAEAADGSVALTRLGSKDIDLVLLDMRMPGMDGVQTLRALRAANSTVPAIVLTTFDDDDALFEAMAGGARGFLLKDISQTRLAQMIRHVHGGDTAFRPVLTERLANALSGSERTAHDKPVALRLTAREVEILALMATRWSNREIGEALGPSEGTIKNHVSNILSKLGVRDRVRAVLRALELGLI